MEVETLENASIHAGGGAGVATAQTVTGKGVQAVLTSNLGPNAHAVLSQAGIQVVTGVSGKVREAVKAYKSGRLSATADHTTRTHRGRGKRMQAAFPDSSLESGLEPLKEEGQTMQ